LTKTDFLIIITRMSETSEQNENIYPELDGAVERTVETSPVIDESVDIIEHLTELRTLIIRSAAAVGILFCVFCYYSDKIMYLVSFQMKAILKGEKLVFIAPAEAFFVSLKVSMFAAILAALPYLLYNLWKFVYIAMTRGEKKYFNLILITSTVSFYCGLLFSIYLAIPVGIGFLIGYSSELFKPMISVNAYYDFLIYTSLVFGIIFELPLLMMFLNKLGIVSKKWLTSNRKYAVLLIFITAGIFSPPDVFSQFLVAIPMLFLYELGIILIRITGK